MKKYYLLILFSVFSSKSSKFDEDLLKNSLDKYQKQLVEEPKKIVEELEELVEEPKELAEELEELTRKLQLKAVCQGVVETMVKNNFKKKDLAILGESSELLKSCDIINFVVAVKDWLAQDALATDVPFETLPPIKEIVKDIEHIKSIYPGVGIKLFLFNESVLKFERSFL